MTHVIVVGAGIGGLASAALLAKRGYTVTLIEKNDLVGGRLSGFSENGFTFDAGPTLLLMPDVLEGFFKKIGLTCSDYLTLIEVDPVYDVYFGPHQKPFTFYRDLEKTIDQLRSLNEKDARAYPVYLAQGKKNYNAAIRYFLSRNVHDPLSLLSLDAIRAFFDIGLSGSYRNLVEKHFSDQRIRDALTFQSIYVGGSPADVPAAYSLIQYAESDQGVWTVQGGLFHISKALLRVCQELGVFIHTSKTVERIEAVNGHATGVTLQDGTFLEADVILCNADLPYAYDQLLPKNTSPVQTRSLEPSCSAFMLYLGVNKKIALHAHTFLLPNNFDQSLTELFGGIIPADPGVYLYCPSKLFPESAPRWSESLYVLVPVPHLNAGIDWTIETEPFKEKIMAKINSWLNVDIRPQDIAYQKVVTPQHWKNAYNLKWGSTFGLYPSLKQSAFWRPQNRDPTVSNLYFVGASTHPGSGIPIVLFSAQNVVDRIKSEQKIK